MHFQKGYTQLHIERAAFLGPEAHIRSPKKVRLQGKSQSKILSRYGIRIQSHSWGLAGFFHSATVKGLVLWFFYSVEIPQGSLLLLF